MTEDEIIYEEAKEFASTLKGKNKEEAIVTLQLKFPGMDIASAKALLILSELQK